MSKQAQFIHHMVQLVLKERALSVKEEKATLQGKLKKLEKGGVAICGLLVSDVKVGVANQCIVELSFPDDDKGKPVPIVQHRIRAGDLVVLDKFSPRDFDIEIRYDRSNCYWSGVISRVRRFNVVLSLYNGGITSISNLPTELAGPCKISKLADNVSYQRMLNAMGKLQIKLNKHQPLIDILLKKIQPPKVKPNGLQFYNKDLNKYQKAAVKFAVSSEVISLIHGPPGNTACANVFYVLHYEPNLIASLLLPNLPWSFIFVGTGKTHTLVEIIKQLAVTQKKRVLVCGPSNVSVDNILERLIGTNGINIARIGHPARVSSEAILYTLDVLCYKGDQAVLKTKIDELAIAFRSGAASSGSTKNEWNQLEKTFRKKKSKVINSILSKVNVVFSTLNSSGNAAMRKERFDTVIIDEAGQATEPDCWIALLKANKAILAGDHLQLAPTVKTPSIPGHGPIVRGMSASTSLSYTLFDRLIDMYGDSIKKMLCVQYRMHSKIMEFSSHELYAKKLIAHAKNSTHLLKHLKFVTKKSPNTTVPILLIDTSDTGKSHEVRSTDVSSSSAYNLLEAEIAIHHVEQLIKDGLKADQIGIITPYAAQVRSIQLMLGEKWQELEVGSVDGFQGREKEAIILTLVRSNNDNNVGFLCEKRRLNVAMTRAKRHLAVICDTSTMVQLAAKTKKKSSVKMDKEFLRKWMTWLLENSVIRYSSELNCGTGLV